MWSDQILTKEGRSTAAGRVARELARKIADGTLAPGSKLPGETVLARRLGVSRPTLREAIRTLAAGRLLQIRPRSGTYVAAALPVVTTGGLEELLAADPSRIWELLEVRRIVDTAAAELAARRRTPSELAELGRTAADFLGARSRGGCGGTSEEGRYQRFFTLLSKAAHNTLLLHLEESMARTLRAVAPDLLGRVTSAPGVADTLGEQLAAVYEAVEAGEAGGAREAVSKHLRFLERSLRNP